MWLLCNVAFVLIGIVGILFPGTKEEAFSANRFWFAFGFMAGYLMALLLDFWIHLSIMLTMVVLNVVAYTCLIIKTETKQELLPCCYRTSEQVEAVTDDSSDKVANHIHWNGNTEHMNHSSK